jgi:hypothetical protein
MGNGWRWEKMGICAGGLMLAGLVFSWCGAATSFGAPPKQAASNLTQYSVDPYYTMFTDVEMAQVKEAAARMAAMGMIYTQQCEPFSARPGSYRWPFYLYAKHEEYTGAPGVPGGSAGVFMPSAGKLMADASYGDEVWHIVQHEGFHQFAFSMIARNLPVWLNEGLAEYFGESLWTGAGMVTGNIPSHRLVRIKELIAKDDLVAFDKMIAMQQTEWNGALKIKNYDQAFFMVTFLLQGGGQTIRDHFVAYVKDLSHGKAPKAAWTGQFGPDTDGFLKQFTTWVNGLTDETSKPLRTRAAFETLMSYLARAHCEKQDFDSIEDFFKAGEDGTVKVKEDLLWYLPPSLLTKRVKEARELKDWSLEKAKDGTPKLTLTLSDGTVYTGTVGASPDSRRPPATKVTVETPKAPKAATTKPGDAASKP